MSTTLYRKYRPQTWDEIVDQNHVKITLEHEIEEGRIAHAYLFSGPRGLGKTTTARIFAKALNCTKRKKGNARPCTECAACVAIRDGTALDVIEIDAASNTGVDHVREHIIASARVAPIQFPYKLFIIDEAHMLSIAAFNALLKTLEEPPPHVVFILATTEIHKIPETILSRCQRFDFRHVARASIVERLRDLATREGVRVDTEVLERIADVAGGSMRDAESILGQVLAIGEQHIGSETAGLVLPQSDTKAVEACLTALIDHDVAGIVQQVDTVEIHGIDPIHLLSGLIRATQILLRHILTRGMPHARGDGDRGLTALGQRTDARNVLHILETLLHAEELLRRSDFPFLVLEVALLESLNLEGSVPLSERTAGTKGGTTRTHTSSNPHGAKESSDGQTESVQVFSFETLVARWDDIVAAVDKRHHALAVILRVGYPIAIDGNRVSIGFEYDFHRERVEDPLMRRAVEEALHEVLGLPIALVVVRAKRPSPHIETESPLVSQILKTFGGEVVASP